MNISQIQREFKVRYYRWAMSDMVREIRDGFPYLKYFRQGSPLYAQKTMSELKLEDQLDLGRGLVKRFHKAPVTEDPLTGVEAGLLNRFDERAAEFSSVELDQLREMLENDNGSLKTTKVTYTQIKMCLNRLNLTQLKDKVGGLWFVKPIDQWNIYTHVERKHRYRGFCYAHHIHSIDELQTVISKRGEPLKLTIPLGRFISLNSWLGIHGETEWADLDESEFEIAARQLATVCSHFLDAAPSLLNGLVVKTQ